MPNSRRNGRQRSETPQSTGCAVTCRTCCSPPTKDACPRCAPPRSSAVANLDLAVDGTNVVRRLRYCCRSMQHRPVVEAEDALVPRALHAQPGEAGIVELGLVQ